jgi:hypothetical protein
MIRVVAILAMLIASGVVAVGSAFLYSAAYHSTGVVWQQPLLGSFVVALAIWEAVAVTAAIALWKHGYRPLAPFAVIALIGATAFTARYDILNQAQSQSDRIAQRLASVDNTKVDRGQLDLLRQQQASWTARLRSAKPTELDDIQDNLEKLGARIDSIASRLDARPAVMEAAPDALLLAQLIGHGDKEAWLGYLALMSILALPLGRILLTPIAVAFWQIAMRREPKPDKKIPYDFHKHLLTPEPAIVATSPVAISSVTAAPMAKLCVVLPSDETMLRQVLTDELPYGLVHLKSIEEGLGRACTKHGRVTPNREGVRSMLAALGIEPGKKDARGARYRNNLGSAKGQTSKRASALAKPAGALRVAFSR